MRISDADDRHRRITKYSEGRALRAAYGKLTGRLPGLK